MITIVGWLWRDPQCKAQYRPEHANVWARMIDRHLAMPHRFVLMTDQPDAEFDPLIEPVRLWDDWRDFRNPRWSNGKPNCYVRLRAFSMEAEEIFGPRFVSIDLDCLVLDSLDPLFDRQEDFVIYRRPMPHGTRLPNVYQGSMWLMTAGARRQVWDDFKGLTSAEAARQYVGSDQAWIRYVLGPDEAGWGIPDGVLGWPSIVGDNRWLNEPPPKTRIIFFQGEMKPWHYLVPTAAICQHCNQPAAVQWPFKIVRDRLPAPSNQWIERFYR